MILWRATDEKLAKEISSHMREKGGREHLAAAKVNSAAGLGLLELANLDDGHALAQLACHGEPCRWRWCQRFSALWLIIIEPTPR